MAGQRGPAVVLLGARGSGKSTLAQALLDGSGTLLPGGLVHGRTPALDVLDPPGAPDLAGALHAALAVADVAALVVSPVQGVDARTVRLWEAAEHLPRVVVLSQLDRPGADADEAVAVCQRLLGEGVLPLQLPLHDDDGSVGGLLDLLHLQVSTGGARRPADPEHVGLVEGLRGELVEAVLTGSEDEELFDRFLDDEEPAPQVLARELRRAVAHGEVQPVLVAVPRRGVGLGELADLLAGLPVRPDAPAAAAADGAPVAPGELVAQVVLPGLLRVWSGRLAPGEVVVGGRPATYAGPPAAAGELVTGLVSGGLVSGGLVSGGLGGRPGDAVGTRPLLLPPLAAPPAAFPVGAPDDAGLAARVAADPVARLQPDPRTGQLLLWTYGPEHAEALLDGLPSAPVVVPPGVRPVPVRVRVPGWAERAVRSDVTARGGQVVAVAPDDAGVALELRLPPAEAVGYALALARVSAHTGTLERL